jgi:hypothetical protein
MNTQLVPGSRAGLDQPARRRPRVFAHSLTRAAQRVAYPLHRGPRASLRPEPRRAQTCSGYVPVPA